MLTFGACDQESGSEGKRGSCYCHYHCGRARKPRQGKSNSPEAEEFFLNIGPHFSPKQGFGGG